MDAMAEMMQMEEQIQKMEQYGAKQRIRKKAETVQKEKLRKLREPENEQLRPER